MNKDLRFVHQLEYLMNIFHRQMFIEKRRVVMKKKLGMLLVTGLSVLLFSVGLAGCDATSSNTGSGHEHVFAEYEYNQDATCSQDGTETATCIFCTATDTRIKEGSALGHDYSDKYTVDVPSTCTETGMRSRHCSRCDSTTDERVVESLGHNLIHHNAKAATCTQIGWNAYDTCSRCDYTTYREIAALDHDIIHHDGQAATCTEKGWIAYDTCSRCDYTTYQEIAATNHANMQEHTAVEATCTTAGNSAYWYCPDCGKYFSDANGETEIAENDWVIAALNHANMQAHIAVEATCTTAGNSAYWYCPDCDKYFSDANGETEIAENDWVIAALNHDIIHHNAQAATCTEKGWNAYDTCSRCDYTTYHEIAALDHDIIHHEGQAATCTEKGWIAYDTCSRCDYTTYQEIMAHHANMQTHVAVEATCITAGNSAYWYCPDCAKYFSDANGETEIAENSWVTAALDHDIIHHDAQAATCTKKGWESYDTCSRCDYTTYREIATLEHNYVGGFCSMCGAEREPTEGLEFTLSADGTQYYVTDYTGTATEVYIPTAIKGLPIASIEWFTFSGCSGLTSITIGNGVTSIGYQAFFGCSSLTSITIPDGVTSIGNYAFQNCSGLTSITIPARLTKIADGLFSGCSALEEVELPAGVTSIGEYAFKDCSGLTSVTIPDSVTSIEHGAFYGCSGLTSV